MSVLIPIMDLIKALGVLFAYRYKLVQPEHALSFHQIGILDLQFIMALALVHN